MTFVGTGDGCADRPGLHHPQFLPPDDILDDVVTAYLAGFRAAVALLSPTESRGRRREHLQ